MGGGGGHGGNGARPTSRPQVYGGPIYGSAELPFDLGSGGGGAEYPLPGAGGGAGIVRYDVFVSSNGSPYSAWQRDATASTGAYPAAPGSYLAFDRVRAW